MDTITIRRAITHAFGRSDTYAHRHRYGITGAIALYYIHSHWYANAHGHYTVAQRRSDVRADPFISAVSDVTANRYDPNDYGIRS